MPPSPLQALIAAGESLTLELKKSTAEKDRACRSLCALANGQGGQAVFGVTPAGKVVGQKVRANDDFVTITFALPATMARSKNESITEQTPEQTPGKLPDLILRQLAAAPSTSIPELAQYLDKSDSAIERAIRKLRDEGKLRRMGPAKGGHWKVLE